MIDCISVENMRRSDAYTIANLVPSLELMFRAADGVMLLTGMGRSPLLPVPATTAATDTLWPAF